MKFIVDAQLPKRLSTWLNDKGFDTIHTLELTNKNKTTDSEISLLSMREERIVISKDSDFYNRYFIKLEPFKLIYLTTGNISTTELINLFEKNSEEIFNEIANNNVVEISNTSIITII